MENTHFDELCRILVQIKKRDDAEALLRDILTPTEIASIMERWQIVKLLKKGVPQREISARLKVSISKVTRGSRAFKKNHGGFKKFL